MGTYRPLRGQTCRVFTKGENAMRPLHVHDNPGSVADATRALLNGWRVSKLVCLAPKTSWTDGDGVGLRAEGGGDGV